MRRTSMVLASSAVALMMLSGQAKQKAGRDLSPDWVAMVLATQIVATQACALRPNNFPLNIAVAKLGQDLVDFMPDGRYAPLVKVKVKKAYEFLAALPKVEACKGMEDTLKQFLPDVYPRRPKR